MLPTDRPARPVTALAAIRRERPFVGRMMLLAAAAMLPLVVLLGLNAWRHMRDAQQAATATVQARSAVIAQQASATLERARRFLEFLAEHPELAQLDSARCSALLSRMVLLDPLWTNIGAATADGRIVCTSLGPFAQQNLGQRASFRAAMAADGFAVSKPLVGMMTRRPVVYLTLPLRNHAGQRVGLVAMGLDLSTWGAQWERAGLPAGSTDALLDADGTVVVGAPEAGLDRDGVERVYASSPVREQAWRAVSGIPTAQVFAPGRQQLIDNLFAAVFAGALAVALSLALARRIAAPLQGLAATARAIAEGRRDARADERAPGEFGDVAIEFNRMLDAHDRADSERREAQRRLQDMLDHVQLLAIVVDRDARIVYGNDFLLRCTGWTRDELIGRDFIEALLPAARALEHAELIEALRGDALPQVTEEELVCRSGERRLIRWNHTVLRSAGGEVTGRACVGEDVTARHAAERSAARLTAFYAALCRTNRAIVRLREPAELYAEICRICVETGHAMVASVVLVEGGELVRVADAGPASTLLPPIGVRADAQAMATRSPLFNALRDGRTAVSNDYLSDEGTRAWHEHARRVGIRAVAALPLRRAGVVIGALTLHVDQVDFFDAALVELLEDMACDLSFALDGADGEAARVAALREAQMRSDSFARVFASTPACAVILAQDDGAIVDINDAACRSFGYRRDELLGRRFDELDSGLTAAQRETLCRSVADTGAVRDAELTMRLRSGEQREFLLNADAIEFDGRDCILTVSTDLTERRLMLGSLRRSLERFQLAAAGGNVWQRDLGEGDSFDMSQVGGLLGYGADARFGDTPAAWFELVHPADRSRLNAALVEHVKRRRPFDVEVRARAIDGAYRWLQVRGQAVWNETGRALRMAGTVFDVTTRRRAEDMLRERELQLSGIVETAMDAIITIDAAQRIVVFNQSAAAMFRVSRDEALGAAIERLVPPALHGTFDESGQRLLLTALRADGEEFPVEASVSRVGHGQRMLTTIVIRDITGQRDAEDARRARAVAEAANRAKTEFLSHISHELRTPLNAVLGFAQMLHGDSDPALNDRQRGHVDHIRCAGGHLLALIDDLLDVSRIEAGQLDLVLGPVSLAESLDSALALCQTYAASRNVSVHPLYRESPGATVRADPVRLRQVVMNLLSNAIKYNRPGGSVRVETMRHEATVQVDIIDTGIGMTNEQLAQLFQPFNRLGRERGEVEGTGIGLTLTRRLVQMMHGTIEVTSENGRGTCVRLQLPPSEDAAATVLAAPGGAPTESVSDPEGLVLYIEDNPVNVMLVEQFLRRWPRLRLESAPDGASGIERAGTSQPDLVLLDLQLPDMDGAAVLRALKSQPGTRELRVVALSASADRDDVERLAAAGALDYWTKPLDFERFEAALRNLLGRRTAPP